MQILNWNDLQPTQKTAALSRPPLSMNADLMNRVEDIIKQVQQDGDNALFACTEKFDGVKLDSLAVSAIELQCAKSQITESAKAAILFAKQQIETYHAAQLPKTLTVETCKGVICERRASAIERVGLYIPGGTAPLISTTLMLSIPAKIAGCEHIALCTPPNKQGLIDPHILYVAELCGITKIYKVGGAQAIAAFAYGTQTIEKVYKIFGPGNAWVTAAKLQVANDANAAAIDLPAGPSEVLVIADDHANASFVAADLLSQAEHGTDSHVMLICFSEELAKRVMDEIDLQMQKLTRADIIKQALNYAKILIVDTVGTALTIANQYAPEHLILQVKNAPDLVPHIKTAGAVFVGAWTPEAVGDYITGSNHVLPTYGFARAHSGLGVSDFMKFISVQTVTESGLQLIANQAMIIAELEGLLAHKLAISLRVGAANE